MSKSSPNFYAVAGRILELDMTVGRWWERPEDDWPSVRKRFGVQVLKNSLDDSAPDAARKFLFGEDFEEEEAPADG